MQKIKKTMSLVLILAMVMSVIGVMSVSADPANVGSATLVPTTLTADAGGKYNVLPGGTIELDVVLTTTKVPGFKGVASFMAELTWPTAAATFAPYDDETAFAWLGIEDYLTSSTVTSGAYKLGDCSVVEAGGTTTLTFIYDPNVSDDGRLLGSVGGKATRITLTAASATSSTPIDFELNVSDVSTGRYNDDTVEKVAVDNLTADVTVPVRVAKNVAAISALSVVEGESGTTDLIAFNAATLTYTVNVANAVDSVTIAATATNDGTITGDGLKGSLNAVGDGDNIFTVTVTSQNTLVTKSYVITVVRAAASAGAPSLTSSEYTFYEYEYADWFGLGEYNVVMNIPSWTPLEDFMNNISVDGTGTVSLFLSDGETDAMTSGMEYVATGMQLVLTDSTDAIVYTADIVIFGDANGDGSVETDDLAYINQAVYGDPYSTLAPCFYIACDLDGDEYHIVETSDCTAFSYMLYYILWEEWLITY